MAINVKLKFSWGHIIAFLAMIFISYVSFLGFTYLTGGAFLWAGVGVLVVDLLLLLIFIFPQVLKGTEEKFRRRIGLERTMMILSIPLFVTVMLPSTHFWAIFAKRNDIEQGFSDGLSKTEEMFSSYEEYSMDRIYYYATQLSENTATERENRLEALRLQLIDENYYALRDEAIKWMGKVRGVTVWNVFMLGNVDRINDAIDNWNASLYEFSKDKMELEAENVKPFTSEHPGVVAAKKHLEGLKQSFVKKDFPSVIAYILIVVLYFMMLLPYALQKRNTKSTYTLWGRREGTVPETHSAKIKNARKEHGNSDYESFEL